MRRCLLRTVRLHADRLGHYGSRGEAAGVDRRRLGRDEALGASDASRPLPLASLPLTRCAIMHHMQDLVVGRVGLRRTKKAATRSALSSVARRLAVAEGFDAVTVEMICADVGVSVRTFFNYFESKEAAIVGDLQPIGTASTRQVFLDAGPTGNLLADLLVLLDPTEAIAAAGRDEITMVFQLVQSEPKVLALQLARGVEHERILAELIVARRRSPADSSDCSTIAAVAQTVLRRGGLQWFLANDDQPISSHIHAAAKALTAFIAGS
jgi:AcrR family transcriptional regulator